MHPLKTKCMLIGSAHKLKNADDLVLQINKTLVQNVDVQKFLGVYVDHTLSWNTQVNKICSKINSKLYLLKNIAHFLSYEMKQLYYNAYIMSTLDYCCTVWGKTNTSVVNKLTKLQKRAARTILCKPIKTPTKELFNKLKWLSYSDRCKYHCALLVFKVLHNLAPEYLSQSLQFANNDNYSLRSALRFDLVSLKPKTKYGKDTFTYYSAHVWNSIPTNIRLVNSVDSFKRKYKAYLLCT